MTFDYVTLVFLRVVHDRNQFVKLLTDIGFLLLGELQLYVSEGISGLPTEKGKQLTRFGVPELRVVVSYTVHHRDEVQDQVAREVRFGFVLAHLFR